MYGGVQMRDLIAMISVLLVVALEICSLSILCSAGANRSVYAALSAYASNLILIGGTLFVHLAPSFCATHQPMEISWEVLYLGIIICFLLIQLSHFMVY